MKPSCTKNLNSKEMYKRTCPLNEQSIRYTGLIRDKSFISYKF